MARSEKRLRKQLTQYSMGDALNILDAAGVLNEGRKLNPIMNYRLDAALTSNAPLSVDTLYDYRLGRRNTFVNWTNLNRLRTNSVLCEVFRD